MSYYCTAPPGPDLSITLTNISVPTTLSTRPLVSFRGAVRNYRASRFIQSEKIQLQLKLNHLPVAGRSPDPAATW